MVDHTHRTLPQSRYGFYCYLSELPILFQKKSYGKYLFVTGLSSMVWDSVLVMTFHLVVF
jgi:hypothetical protein